MAAVLTPQIDHNSFVFPRPICDRIKPSLSGFKPKTDPGQVNFP